MKVKLTFLCLKTNLVVENPKRRENPRNPKRRENPKNPKRRENPEDTNLN